MSSEWIWSAAAAGGALALVLSVACALLWRNGRRLSARLAELEAAVDGRTAMRAPSTGAADPTECAPAATYLITSIEHEHDQELQPAATTVPARIDGKLFADIVARESVVKAAGLAHGLRRALSAESRNRIGFEVRREVKRSRKQRRADLKAALRHLQSQDAA